MGKKVFIACPIGADKSPERQRSDQLLAHVISPAVGSVLDVEPEEVVIRADKIGEPGRITTQILRELGSADVVIADLTGTNANVMYEVGIRQALMRPYILMAEHGQTLPFDLSDFRTIFYVLDLDGAKRAQLELKAQLQKALTGQVPAADTALFGQFHTTEATSQLPQASQNLLEVLEACNQILRETQETKELLITVGNITLDIQQAEQKRIEAYKEAQTQEQGMWFLNQMLQNPDGVDKILPVMEFLTNLNKAQEQIDSIKTAQPKRTERPRQQRSTPKQDRQE